MAGNNLLPEKLDMLLKKLNRVLETGSTEVPGYGTTFTWNGGQVFDPFNCGISMEDAEKVKKLVLGPNVKQVASVTIPISQGLYNRAYKSQTLDQSSNLSPVSFQNYSYGQFVSDLKTGYIDLVFPNIEELEIQADAFKGVTNVEPTIQSHPPNGRSDNYHRKLESFPSGNNTVDAFVKPDKEKGGILSDLFFNKTYFTTNVNKGNAFITGAGPDNNPLVKEIVLLFPYSDAATYGRNNYSRNSTNPLFLYRGYANGLPIDLIKFKTLTLRNLKTIKVKRWIFFNIDNLGLQLNNASEIYVDRPFGPFIGDFKGDVYIETEDAHHSMAFINGFHSILPNDATSYSSASVLGKSAYPHFGYTEPYDVLAPDAKTMTIKFKYNDDVHRRKYWGDNGTYYYDANDNYEKELGHPHIHTGDRTNSANMSMTGYCVGFGKFILDYSEFPGSKFIFLNPTDDLVTDLGNIVLFRPAQLHRTSIFNFLDIPREEGRILNIGNTRLHPEYGATGGWADWVKDLNYSFENSYNPSLSVNPTTFSFNGSRDVRKPYAIAKVILPNQLTVLPRGAFYGAGGFVTEFNWPTSLTYINSYALTNIVVEHLNIPSTVTRLGLQQNLYNGRIGVSHVKEITVPNSVTTHLRPDGTSVFDALFHCDSVSKYTGEFYADWSNDLGGGNSFGISENGVELYRTIVPCGLQTFNYYAQYQLGDRYNLGANYFTHMPLVENSFTLTTVNILNGFDIGRTGFRNCPNISVASLLDIISKLRDRSALSEKTFEMGVTNLAKLTPEQIAVATNKNWTLY
jgi:hypothetical protein